MKAERIETEKAGKWDGTYPVLLTHKLGNKSKEMTVLFTEKSAGIVVVSNLDSDHPMGYYGTTWDDSVFTYLPETDVIVLSNKED